MTRRSAGRGAREMSWIWRRAPAADEEVPYDSVRVEWAKMRARVLRWKEEKVLLLEEMRCVVMFLRWKATWWMEHVDLRASTSIEVRMGLNAYAYKQADLFLYIASTFINGWVPVLKNLGLPHENFESLESSGSFVPRHCSIARTLSEEIRKESCAAAPAVSVQNSTPLNSNYEGVRAGSTSRGRHCSADYPARRSRPHVAASHWIFAAALARSRVPER